MWQGWINLVLGIWLIITGFVPSLQTPVNFTIVGILAAVFGFWAAKQWQGIVAGILGLWALLNGIWFHIFADLNFIIVGILLGAAGLWCGLIHPPKHEIGPSTQ